jgi:hypothetical protein
MGAAFMKFGLAPHYMKNVHGSFDYSAHWFDHRSRIR